MTPDSQMVEKGLVIFIQTIEAQLGDFPRGEENTNRIHAILAELKDMLGRPLDQTQVSINLNELIVRMNTGPTAADALLQLVQKVRLGIPEELDRAYYPYWVCLQGFIEALKELEPDIADKIADKIRTRAIGLLFTEYDEYLKEMVSEAAQEVVH